MLTLREYMWAGEGPARACNRRAVSFEVLGLPELQEAWIATNGHSWQVLRAANSIYGEWFDKYGSLEAALTGVIGQLSIESHRAALTNSVGGV